MVYVWNYFFATTIRSLIGKFTGVWITAIVPIFEGYFAWFLYGYLLNRINFSKTQRYISYILGIIGGLISIVGTYMLSDISSIDPFFNGGYEINSYMVSTAVFIFFKYEVFINNKIVDKISITMGKLSYGVYLIHVLVLEKLQKLIVFDKPYIEILCYSVFTFLISYIIIYLLSKLPYLGYIATGTK